MIVKRRNEPRQLSVLTELNKRKVLTKEESDYLTQLNKGYEGEVAFDRLTSELVKDALVLNDLLFEINRQSFQIDTLIISGDNIYLYEIKNYQGEYTVRGNELISSSYKRTVLSPFNQLSRTAMLFNVLLKNLRTEFKLETYVVFVHPEFVLHNNSKELAVLLPQQIKKHLNQLASKARSVSSKQKRLADNLISQHIKDNRFEILPAYDFDELDKQVRCWDCLYPLEKRTTRTSKCTHCAFIEVNALIIMREINTFRLLFPEKKLTSKTVYEWCGQLYSKASIRNILASICQEVGAKKGKYYVSDLIE